MDSENMAVLGHSMAGEGLSSDDIVKVVLGAQQLHDLIKRTNEKKAALHAWFKIGTN